MYPAVCVLLARVFLYAAISPLASFPSCFCPVRCILPVSPLLAGGNRSSQFGSGRPSHSDSIVDQIYKLDFCIAWVALLAGKTAKTAITGQFHWHSQGNGETRKCGNTGCCELPCFNSQNPLPPVTVDISNESSHNVLW